jgi:DNA repair protein RecO (recombination protein O)
MPTYTITAINIGGFSLGEADKVLNLFSAEKGLLKGIAKGARKPGTKMAGRADLLNVNKLLMASGKTFEIITQAESIETFPGLRKDLTRLAYGLYYAEIVQHFAQGIEDENEVVFAYLINALAKQAESIIDPTWLCLKFEMGFLEILGFKPELTYCIGCRQVLTDYNVSNFNLERGGIVCERCHISKQYVIAEEHEYSYKGNNKQNYISPLVWKHLICALQEQNNIDDFTASKIKTNTKQAIQAAQRLIKNYIELRASKKMKSLDLLSQINATN